jgi:biotin carboxylase
MYLRIAVLGASYLQKPLYQKLREMNIFSIGLSWDRSEDCVQEGLVDKYYEVSIIEKEKVLKICLDEKIDGIVSIASDVAVPVISYVAEKMNLVGNSVESSLWATNKIEMRKRFEKFNLPIPKFGEIKSSKDAITFFKTSSQDLIIKPSDRSGSLGVQLVPQKCNLEELEVWADMAISSSFSKTAIIEEFIKGKEISVEYISFEGKHYFLNTTDKVTSGPPHYVELEQHQPSLIADELLQRVKDLVPKALNSLGITTGASHTELLIDDENQPWITEIGARMGGDLIGSTLTKLSTGYDFVEGVINSSFGKFEEPKVSQSMHSGILFLSKETKEVLKIIQSDDDERIVERKVMSNELKEVKKSSDRSGYFIYQSSKRFSIE